MIGCEGEDLLSEISVLMKELSECASAAFHHGKTQKGGYPPGSRSSPDPESPGTMALGSPISRIVRNKCLLCKLPSLWYFCYNDSMDYDSD